jgi:hypothetical protein
MVHRKHRHLFSPPPDDKDALLDDWLANDAVIISWLLSSLKPAVAQGVATLHPAKCIWDSLKHTYGHQNNISKVFQTYEELFKVKQGDHSCQEHYSYIQGLISELNLYQPPTTNLATVVRHREELVVSAYLASLDPGVAAQVRGSILRGGVMPDLEKVFSRVLRVSTLIFNHDSFSTSVVDQSTLVVVNRGDVAPRREGREAPLNLVLSISGVSLVLHYSM